MAIVLSLPLMPYQSQSTHSSSLVGVLVICAISVCFSAYILVALAEVSTMYAESADIIKKDESVAKRKITFTGTDRKVHIPTFKMFTAGEIWSLTSFKRSLPDNFVPNDLMETTLAHGDSREPMMYSQKINQALEKLFAAAEVEGYTFMISSAYRSVDDQRVLYDNFVASKGETLAKRYVATPGTSEHHTGLSIDLSDADETCALDSNGCQLSFDSIDWLATNAYEYGFINRYPEGKQPITGIGFEPWHYRYVGIPLAAALYESDLTLDEAIEQMAPGYSR